MTTSPFNIQLATADDTAEIIALVNAAYSKWIPIVGREPSPMLADYPAIIAKREAYTTREGDTLVAVLVIRQMDDALYISNIAVSPDHQKRGIGDLLLNFAEQKAREMNLNMMRLRTNEKMESNRAYYLKHGYIETRLEITGDNRRVVWMHKPL